mgnify:CR=1 FL=1
MKAKEVMKILNICRTTLYKYTKDGTLKSIQLDNGYFDYDEKSVYSLLKKDDRHDVIYARVSTYKQKIDLNTQISKIQTYCTENNIQINQKSIIENNNINTNRTPDNNQTSQDITIFGINMTLILKFVEVCFLIYYIRNNQFLYFYLTKILKT